MANKAKIRYKVICAIAGIIILLFLNTEMRSAQIYNSSIFTTPGNTEIKISVLMNTLLPVDEEKLVKRVISEEQKINGVRENPVYIVKLYRSLIHYRNGWEYDFLFCDETGAIICSDKDSVL